MSTEPIHDVASSSGSATAAPESRRRSPQRRDIQGLRALAVLAVVANHLWERRLPGGFVGVDIFFVISGFLITGLLVREYERTGTISFSRFYLRRFKRLVPAAALVIATTVAVSFALLTDELARGIMWDGLWATLFGENWYLIAKSTDYFAQSDGATPLQHYWSLSVEEQFYLVWPWMLLLLLFVFARGKRGAPRRVRMVAGMAMAVVIPASFGWALHQAITEPTTAYFSTFTRGWELGLGALLAVMAPGLERLGDRVRTTLAYAGLAAMMASLFIFDDQTAWPAPWALLPTLGAAAVIVSGIGREARGNVLLTNPVAVYLGDISYSLYLWHFPVIFFAGVRFVDGGRVVDAAVLAVSLLLAAATYHAIEGPIHHSPLGDRGRGAGWTTWWASRRRGVIRGGIAFGATAAVVVVLVVAVPPKSATALVSEAALSDPSANPEVVAAFELTTWPDPMTPSLDSDRTERYAAPWVIDGCMSEHPSRPQDAIDDLASRCIYGDPDAEHDLVVLGDSVAISWVPAFEEALKDRGWRITVLAAAMCPVADVDVEREQTGTPYPGCSEFRHRAFEIIEGIAPDLVVASETSSTQSRLMSAASGDAAETEVAEGMARSLERLERAAGDVVLIETVPKTWKISGCYSPYGGPADCTGSVEKATLAHRRTMERALALHSVPYVDPAPLFCISDVCPPVVGGYLTRTDGVHLSDAYARHIGPAVWEMIAEATAR